MKSSDVISGGLLFCGLVLIGKAAYDDYKTRKSIAEAEKHIAQTHDELINTWRAEDEKFDSYCKEMDEWLEDFKSRLGPEQTFEDSIKIARDTGVPEEEIIHNMDELDEFFLG